MKPQSLKKVSNFFTQYLKILILTRIVKPQKVHRLDFYFSILLQLNLIRPVLK